MRYARYALAVALTVVPVLAQDVQPTNDAPNPYNTVKDYFKLPDGRTWGSTSAVDIDKDGKSIWVAERCGPFTPSGNSCLDRTTGKLSDLPSVLKFDATGKLVKSFGAGMLIFPHGIYVDRDGNVWVTDGQDNGTVPARGGGGGRAARGGAEAGAGAARAAAPAGPIGPPADATVGNQVFKFSPDGKVLLTLGKAGGAAAPNYFYQPNDVITAPNGDIFVSEGTRTRQQPHSEVRQNGQVPQGVGQARHRPGRVRSAARARLRLAGTSVRRRSQQQPRPGVRSERHLHHRIPAVQPAERHLHQGATRSTSRIRNPSRCRATTTAGNAASAGAASRPGRLKASSPIPMKKRPAPAPRKASRSMPPAIFMAPKSDRRR